MDMRSIKVLMLDPSGSSSDFVHALCNSLVEKGCDVELFTGPYWTIACGQSKKRQYKVKVWFYRRTQIRSYRSAGIRKFGWKILRLSGHIISMFRLLFVALKYDLIHVQWFTVPSIDVFWLWVVSKYKPIVYTAHNLYPQSYRSKSMTILIYRSIYRNSDEIIAHSDYVRKGLMSDFQIKPENVTRVPLGNVDHLLEFKNSVANDLSGQSEGHAILFFGQIRENKGLDVLMRAMPLVVKHVPTARLKVVGVPLVDMKQYYDLARDLDISDVVDFRLGYVEENELFACFESASVVALPYLTIGQSGVAVAACTFGKAIVATRCGGIEELVDEAKNGILVSVGDAVGIGEAISEILMNKDLREKFEKNSREYANTELSWSRIADQTIRLYEEVLAHSNRVNG